MTSSDRRRHESSLDRRRLVVVLLAVVAIAAQPAPLRKIGRSKRWQMFMQQGCHGCHTVGKHDPQRQRPAAHMPKLDLTEPQIAALATFLASLH